MRGGLQTREIVFVGLFAALSAIGAFIKFPLPPVPITLQVFFVLLAGLLLGPRLGALSQFIYLIIGLIGIPIFAEGGGPGYIFHPSFGYLIGFIAAAWVMGKLTGKTEFPGKIQIFYASVISLGVIYIFGLPYLYLALNYFAGVEISVMGAVKSGLLLFLPGDAVKIVLLTMTGPAIVKGIQASLR